MSDQHQYDMTCSSSRMDVDDNTSNISYSITQLNRSIERLSANQDRMMLQIQNMQYQINEFLKKHP